MTKNQTYVENRLNTSLKQLAEFPSYFLIENIFACNSDCIMCPAKKSKRQRVRMPEEMILRLLDEIAEHRDTVEKVQFYLHGEPCLDQDLPKWVAQTKSRGIRIVHTATNGSRLDKNMSKRLLEAGLDQIYIAVDGSTEETVAAIRRGLSLETIKKNINDFLSLRDSLGTTTKVRILMVVQDKNIHEVEDWKTYWQARLGQNDELYANRITNWGGQVETGSFYKPQDDSLPCVFPLGTMPIMADGTVCLCCEDVSPVYKMGDVHKSSIDKIWKSNSWQEIRDLHLNGKKGNMRLCRGCDVTREDKYIENIIINEEGKK